MTTRNKPFLLHDSRESEPEKPIFFIFASEEGLQRLASYRSWCTDGTFYSCSKYFDQLVTINVVIEQSSLPAVYLLLPDRKTETYRRAWAAIFDRPELENVAPDSFVSGQNAEPTPSSNAAIYRLRAGTHPVAL